MGYRRLAAIVALASAVLIGLFSGTALASDNSGQHICLTNASGSCLDLSNDSFTNGNTVWMFDSSGGGLGWQVTDTGKDVCDGGSCGNPWPFTSGTGLNTAYNGDAIYVIHKTQGTTQLNGCLSGSALEGGGIPGQPTWSAYCQDNSGFNLYWVKDSGGRLVSVDISNRSRTAEVMSATGTANYSAVYLVPPGTSGYWQRWTF